MLFSSGAGGTGKTTLAYEVAKKANRRIHVVSALGLKSDFDFYSLLKKVAPLDIVFIDEWGGGCKKLDLRIRPLLENFIFDMGGDTFHFPSFTVVIATNDSSSISNPLMTRLTFKFNFDPYSDAELQEIAKNKAEQLGISISPEVYNILVDRSRKIPRNIVHFVEVMALLNKNWTSVTKTINLLRAQGYYENGINNLDVKILDILSQLSPISQSNLIHISGETRETIRQTESKLLTMGYTIITPKGREITQKGQEFLEKI